MKLLDSLMRKAGYVSAGDAEVASWQAPPSAKAYDAGAKVYSTADAALAGYFGERTYAGKNVTDESAMQIAAVYTCVRILAESFGQLPLKVYEKRPNGSEVPVEHDILGIFEDAPNADMTPVEAKETTETNLVLQGNSYALKSVRGDGQVSSLYPIDSCTIEPKQKNDGTIYYKFQDRGKSYDLPREQVWHVKGFGDNGLVGFSPISYMRQLMGTSLATEEFQARFFSNGANPSWIVSIPQWLNDDQRLKARENLQLLLGGASNAHKVHLLEGGMQATSATMPLEDAQFLQLAKLSRDLIFGVYRIPPHLGGNLERSTNNNIETQSLEFLKYALMPYLTRFESSIVRWLFPASARRGYCVRFDVEELLRSDSAARANLYTKYVQNGIMDRGEVRQRERLPERNDADLTTLTIQSNLIPLDMVREVAEKLSQPQSGGISGDPSENADPNQATDNAGGKAQSILVLNQLRLPDSHMKLHVAQPEVKFTAENHLPEIKAPAIHVEAPNVNVGAPTIDLMEVAQSLAKFAGAAEKLAAAMDMDTEVRKDDDGNIIGTHRVPRKQD
jgi:HK97 family phage portal protein